jgi:hypothetical protein
VRPTTPRPVHLVAAARILSEPFDRRRVQDDDYRRLRAVGALRPDLDLWVHEDRAEAIAIVQEVTGRSFNAINCSWHDKNKARRADRYRSQRPYRLRPEDPAWLAPEADVWADQRLEADVMADRRREARALASVARQALGG